MEKSVVDERDGRERETKRRMRGYGVFVERDGRGREMRGIGMCRRRRLERERGGGGLEKVVGQFMSKP